MSTRTGTPPIENTFHVFPANIVRAYSSDAGPLAVASVVVNDDMRRALDFENGIRERCATRTEPFEWGTALFNSGLPLVWDLNFLRADAPSGATAGDLIAEADRLLGGAGYEHRRLDVEDEEEALRLAPGFLASGWTVLRDGFMVLRRESEPRPGHAVDQVSWEELRPIVEAQLRLDPTVTTEEAVLQLSARRAVDADATHLRRFAARVDGRIAAYCDLYSDGATAQIEDVATLEEYRNRGLARAVVRTATETALTEGHDFVFLVADEDDWPKALYARLGFDLTGTRRTFRRTPDKG